MAGATLGTTATTSPSTRSRPTLSPDQSADQSADVTDDREHTPADPAGPDQDPRASARTDAVAPADLPPVDPVPSFDEVATRYGNQVYSMAYRLTGDEDEARDLAQDVFVRVYRNLDKYEPGTFSGWLYRVTKNLFLDGVRRRRRFRMEALPDEDWKQPVDPDAGPAERLEQGLLRGDIEQAILTLPPTFRAAVVMCDVQGLTYDEIAAATGWPLGTVRSRIHRGRRLLRDALTVDADDA